MKKFLILLLVPLIICGCAKPIDDEDNVHDEPMSSTTTTTNVEDNKEDNKTTTTTKNDKTTTTTKKTTNKKNTDSKKTNTSIQYDKYYVDTTDKKFDKKSSTYLIFTKDNVTININMCEGFFKEKFTYSTYTSKGVEYIKIKNKKDILYDDYITLKIKKNTLEIVGKVPLDCGNGYKFKLKS